MNTAPEFAPYPLVAVPVYSRWLASGVALLALVSSASVFLRPFIEPRLAVVGVAGALMIWVVAFLLRVLHYRLNRHNAQCYAEAVERVCTAWWAHHRQRGALIETVLIGPSCSAPEHRQGVFDPDTQLPAPHETSEGATLRLQQVFGTDTAERERQLAVLLALQWQAQRTEGSLVQPVCCYWQGSLPAWQAFAQQMRVCFPQVELPAQPETWQGIRSVDAIIDRLQGAAPATRILCAGCQSTPPQRQSRLPAGEAGVLWWLGPQGGVSLTRGEGFAAGAESLAAVAARALKQGELEGPAQRCVSFTQPDVAEVSTTGWPIKQNVQDGHFGELAHLQPFVVQTLAAWYAEQHGEPCTWLSSDLHHTLALGVVKPDESSR